MKSAIGGISLFQIVILFILLFTGIMCLTINESKAFGVKDEIINIIETENIEKNSANAELSQNTMDKIVKHLKEIGYRTTGECPKGSNWIGYNRDGHKVTNNASFCLRKVSVDDAYGNDLKNKCNGKECIPTSGDFPKMIYYDVIMFYQLDIPIINNVFNLKLRGSTKTLVSEKLRKEKLK